MKDYIEQAEKYGVEMTASMSWVLENKAKVYTENGTGKVVFAVPATPPTAQGSTPPPAAEDAHGRWINQGGKEMILFVPKSVKANFDKKDGKVEHNASHYQLNGMRLRGVTVYTKPFNTFENDYQLVDSFKNLNGSKAEQDAFIKFCTEKTAARAKTIDRNGNRTEFVSRMPTPAEAESKLYPQHLLEQRFGVQGSGEQLRSPFSYKMDSSAEKNLK